MDPEKSKNDDLSARFHSLARELMEYLEHLSRCYWQGCTGFKRLCCEFLTHFLPLSQPVLYMEFNKWHQSEIHNDKLVALLGARLAFTSVNDYWQEDLLIMKILGVLMRNPRNRTSLHRCGAIQTLMNILQRPAPGRFCRKSLRTPRKMPAASANSPPTARSTANASNEPMPNEMPQHCDESLNNLSAAFSALSLGRRTPPPCRECKPLSCPNTIYPGVHEHTDSREEACVVLRRLALDMKPAQEICRLNGISILLKLIANTEDSLELREKACAVLGNSFCSNTEKAQFASLGGFQTLMQAMRDSVPHTYYLEVYCRAIANAIANCPQNKIELTQQGGIPLILERLCDEDQVLQSEFLAMALRVLTNVSRSTVGINEVAQQHGMHRLIQLCRRIKLQDAKDKHMKEHPFFDDDNDEISEQPEPISPPRIKSPVDRGILFCFEEFIYQSVSLDEFYEWNGIDALITIIRRESRNPQLLQYACKTAREVISASQGVGRSEGSQTSSTGYTVSDRDSREFLAATWMDMLEEAVSVIQSYPYHGEYASEFSLKNARMDARPAISCEPGPPAKRVRFHYCHLIEDIVRWFPIDGRKEVNGHHFAALTSEKNGIRELDVLPRDLLKLTCEFLPIQEWTC